MTGVYLVTIEALPNAGTADFAEFGGAYVNVYVSEAFVSLLMFCLSIALWASYRRREAVEAGAPHDKSLERTREG